jgi:long-chain fatty acid transport protein
MKMRLFKVVLLLTGLLPGLSAAQLSGFPIASFTAGGTGLTPFYVLGFELGPWQDYLARELTPAYLSDSTVESLHITWMDMQSVLILPGFAEDLMDESPSHLQIKLEWQYSTDSKLPGFDQKSGSPGFGFERQLLAPGIVHRVNENQVFGVAAVFAYQSYSTTNLGVRSFNNNLPNFLQMTDYSPYQETGYGTGVRLAVRSELVPGMAIDAGFQSRIDMEEFANYRGVYSQPADLDIPARASVGLALQASNRSWLNFSVERVLYSDVNAFPSRLLPDRFLSLLGDSTSPAFSWDDLTVYSVGWTWSDGEDTEWRVDFSSRSQPNPTSSALSTALSSDLADSAMILGYSKRTGINSRFNFNAAYAPAEYAFGGSVLGVASENLDQNLEVEAFWTWDF